MNYNPNKIDRVHKANMRVHVQIHINIHMCIYIYIYNMCTLLCVCMYIYILCICIYNSPYENTEGSGNSSVTFGHLRKCRAGWTATSICKLKHPVFALPNVRHATPLQPNHGPEPKP